MAAVDMSLFVIRGVLLIIVSAVGLVGNILTLVVISRKCMRSSINCLLVGMVACDIIFLFTYLFVYGLRSIYPYTGSHLLYYYQYQIYPFIVPYLYPIAKSAQTMSVYLTVAVTLERWVMVCHPLRAKTICTYARARWCVIGTAIFAFIYGAPRFFEYEIVESQMNNETVYNANFKQTYYTDMYHLVYRHWMYSIVMYIVPISALAVFNACIVRQVWRTRDKRAEMTGVQRREIRLATMSLAIVVVFFVCNLLPLVRNSLYVSGILGGKEALIYTSDFLLTVNHAVNFIIYAIFSEVFRRAFLETFSACIPGHKASDMPKCPTDTNYSVDSADSSITKPQTFKEGSGV